MAAHWAATVHQSAHAYPPQLQIASTDVQLRQVEDRHKDMQKLEVNFLSDRTNQSTASWSSSDEHRSVA